LWLSYILTGVGANLVSWLLATFTKKHSLSWSFWCRFWVIFNQRPCKGTWNRILNFIVLLFSVAPQFLTLLVELDLDVLGLEEDP
jgi:hypothetical protein